MSIDKVEWSDNIDWWKEKLTPYFFDFVRGNKFRVNWSLVSQIQNMTADFIREFKDDLDWKILNSNQSIDEKILEEFWDKIDWKDILTRREFSEEFLKKHRHQLDWGQVSYFQGQLSEDFVNEMEHYIVWDKFNPYRSTYNQYSNEFKVKHYFDMSEYISGVKFWGEEVVIDISSDQPRVVVRKI